MCSKELFSKIYSFSAAFLFVTAASCSGKPSLVDNPEGRQREVSISYLKSLYTGTATAISEELVIRGRITSTDRFGNFYHTLILEDETGAISVKINMDDYFLVYPIGREAVVYCNSLILGSYGGHISLGVRSADSRYENSAMPSLQAEAVISVSNTDPDSLEPMLLTVPELSVEFIDRYVYFKNMHYTGADAATWCDPETEGDTERVIADGSGNTIAVRTSAYATFGNWTIPAGEFSITGIIGYFNGAYSLTIDHPAHVLKTYDR